MSIKTSANVVTSMQEKFLAAYPEPVLREYRPFRAALYAEMLPQSELENIYFEQFAFAHFSLLRCQLLEVYNEQNAAENPGDEQAIRNVNTIRRMIANYEKRAARALKTFNDFKANRILNQQLEADIQATAGEPVAIPIATPTMSLLIPSQRRFDRETTTNALYRSHRNPLAAETPTPHPPQATS
jgi:hypothetical protein